MFLSHIDVFSSLTILSLSISSDKDIKKKEKKNYKKEQPHNMNVFLPNGLLVDMITYVKGLTPTPLTATSPFHFHQT